MQKIVVSADRGRGVREALEELGRRRITSLLLEGGSRLAGSFIGAGEVDELRIFIAPLLLGAGPPLAAGPLIDRVDDGERALAIESERCGTDVLIRARLREW